MFLARFADLNLNLDKQIAVALTEAVLEIFDLTSIYSAGLGNMDTASIICELGQPNKLWIAPWCHDIASGQ